MNTKSLILKILAILSELKKSDTQNVYAGLNYKLGFAKTGQKQGIVLTKCSIWQLGLHLLCCYFSEFFMSVDIQEKMNCTEK